MTALDRKLMKDAKYIAGNSPNRGRKTSCIITTKTGAVCAAAVNTFCHGIEQKEERFSKPDCYLWIEHAERNAIYEAAKAGIPLDGCTAYSPWFPCAACARALVQSGITRLVAYRPDFNDANWGAEFVIAVQLLKEGGVTVEYCEE